MEGGLFVECPKGDECPAWDLDKIAEYEAASTKAAECLAKAAALEDERARIHAGERLSDIAATCVGRPRDGGGGGGAAAPA